MSTPLKVLITPEIQADGVLEDRCGDGCGWGLKDGTCLLFNEDREPTDDGQCYRLSRCHEAEVAFEDREEGV